MFDAHGTPNKTRFTGLFFCFAMALLALAGPALAQQSVQAQLDECIRNEQRTMGTAGSVIGFLSRFSVSVTRSESPRAAQAQDMATTRGGNNNRPGGGGGLVAGIGGAAAGGALGLASAWFNAMAACLDDHPEWVPASRLDPGGDYRKLADAAGYKPEHGLQARVLATSLPAEARPDTAIQVNNRFLVLTPNGEETTVLIERRLFVFAEGEEMELRLPAHMREWRVLPAGEHVDVLRLPIPKDAPLGVSYRVEFSVSVPPVPAASAQGSVRVL